MAIKNQLVIINKIIILPLKNSDMEKQSSGIFKRIKLYLDLKPSVKNYEQLKYDITSNA